MPAGNVYVRIAESDAPTAVQLYSTLIELTLACSDDAIDCNANDRADACDIAQGVSSDGNANDIPDECESPGTPYCFGDGLDPAVTALCPCANFGTPGHGCANSFSSWRSWSK